MKRQARLRVALARLSRRSDRPLAARVRRLIRLLPIGVARKDRWLAAWNPLQVLGALPAEFDWCVVVVSHELSPSGAPKIAVQVAAACRAAGWAVVVVAPAQGPQVGPLLAMGAVVVLSDAALGPYSPALLLGADAVVANTVSCHGVVEALGAARVVWFIHEGAYLRDITAAFPAIKSLLGRTETWSPSRRVQMALEEMGVSSRMIGVAVPPAPVGDPRPAAARPLGLVLGSLEQRKGQDLLAAAMARLPGLALDVAFYGEIRDLAFTAALNAAISGDDRLSYRGVLTPDAATAAVGAADMVIVCSRDEPLSLVAIEAMSAGRIVVTTKASGIASYLVDGESGFVAEGPSVDALEDCLVRALAEANRWAEIGARAKQIYRAHFAPDRFAVAVRERLASNQRG